MLARVFSPYIQISETWRGRKAGGEEEWSRAFIRMAKAKDLFQSHFFCASPSSYAWMHARVCYKKESKFEDSFSSFLSPILPARHTWKVCTMFPYAHAMVVESEGILFTHSLNSFFIPVIDIFPGCALNSELQTCSTALYTTREKSFCQWRRHADEARSIFPHVDSLNWPKIRHTV